MAIDTIRVFVFKEINVHTVFFCDMLNESYLYLCFYNKPIYMV